MVSYLILGAFRNSEFRDEVLGARSAVGYWGQTPISLQCLALHLTGEPKARQIWALTPITREDCEHRATTQFARKMNL